MHSYTFVVIVNEIIIPGMHQISFHFTEDTHGPAPGPLYESPGPQIGSHWWCIISIDRTAIGLNNLHIFSITKQKQKWILSHLRAKKWQRVRAHLSSYRTICSASSGHANQFEASVGEKKSRPEFWDWPAFVRVSNNWTRFKSVCVFRSDTLRWKRAESKMRW